MARVLVVDDEAQLALAVQIRLEAAGHQVTLAANGQDALQQSAAQRPDIILLDVMMPIMDGYSCLRELNRRDGKQRPPVIMLTARDQMQDLFRLEGMSDYVVKPFDHQDLLLRISRLLAHRSDRADAS